MKTIKQIADELGVSKQAVFYRIKKPPLSNALQSLMVKENGVLMVDFDGEALIKQAFDNDTAKTFDDKEPSKENTLFDGEIMAMLKENIAILQKELDIKNEQIADCHKQIKESAEALEREREHSRQQAEKLSDLSQQLADLTRNSQILFKHEQDKTIALLPEQSEGAAVKTSLFKRLFKRD